MLIFEIQYKLNTDLNIYIYIYISLGVFEYIYIYIYILAWYPCITCTELVGLKLADTS